MTIQEYSDGLLKALERKIVKLTAAGHDLSAVGKVLTEVRSSIRELKAFTLAYRFSDPAEEIAFFKTAKPHFISHYVFYRKVFAIVLFDSFREPAAREKNYLKTLRTLEQYAIRHQNLYEYWITASNDLDNHYFLRTDQSERLIDHDEKFSTGYDVRLGKLLAHDRLRKYVSALLASDQVVLESPLAWTASKFSLIELVYALHAAKTFNNGNADIKDICATVEKTFKISLGNVYRYFQDIRARKINQTIFLDQLKEALKQHIERANE